MNVLKYPGSKQSLSQQIISLFPSEYQKMTYLEPFFGSGAVFFNKARSKIETINDADGEVYNFFLQLRENSSELARLIELTPWHRDEYSKAYDRTDNNLENARRFLVRMWLSIGARPYCVTGFRTNIKKQCGNIQSFHSQLPVALREAANRLKHSNGSYCQIENTDAFTLIEKYNRTNVLMYLDPPYVKQTRKNKYIYTFEMTDDKHLELCRLIKNSKAKVILSGYENELYDSELRNWNKNKIKSYDERGHLRTECLWYNYPGEPVLEFI